MNRIELLIAADLFVIAQLVFCASYYQLELEDPAKKRGLHAAGIFCLFGACVFAYQALLHFHRLVQDDLVWWVLILLFIADQLVAAIVEYISSRYPSKKLLRLANILGGLFAGLLSFLPLPKTKEPEKEIIIVKDENTTPVLENAIELSNKSIDEICTHRSEVVTLSLNDSHEDWKKTIESNRLHFYPVTQENEDDVVGILDVREWYRQSDKSFSNIMNKAVDKPFFVVENTRSDELIAQMKKNKTYFAVVLDEYGGMTGIITLYDIMEELIGEFQGPKDSSRPADILQLSKDTWRISGSAELEDVSKALGVKLELDDMETFSGYILGSIGYIPEDNTQLEIRLGDLDIQIKAIKNHRIRQTLVKKIEPESEELDLQNIPVPKPVKS